MVETKELASDMPIKIEETCAIRATDRPSLIATINKTIDSSFFDGTNSKTYLHVALSGEQLGCKGCSADYATEADVPYHSIPCTCGNPKHWLIKYGKENCGETNHNR